MSGEYIALVRSNPCADSADALLASLADAASRHASATAFFHGAGCDLAHRLASDARLAAALGALGALELRVCATAWARRYEPAPPPLVEASLVLLYQRMASAQRTDSYSPAGGFCGVAPGAGPQSASRLLLEVASAPADARDRRETLELALGAAALELPAGVLFRGPGVQHLVGEGARGWRQVTDFGLLEMSALGRVGPGAGDSGVAVVDAAGVLALRAAAATILLL